MSRRINSGESNPVVQFGAIFGCGMCVGIIASMVFFSMTPIAVLAGKLTKTPGVVSVISPIKLYESVVSQSECSNYGGKVMKQNNLPTGQYVWCEVSVETYERIRKDKVDHGFVLR